MKFELIRLVGNFARVCGGGGGLNITEIREKIKFLIILHILLRTNL